MPPELASYDVVLINTSAGKDSQAMLDVVVEDAQAEGVRDRLVAVHADLGRVEWPGTRELAAEHAAHYGIRFEVVRNPNWADLLERIEARGAFPDAARRWCTSDFKRSPVHTLLTRLVAERRDPAGMVHGPDGASEKRHVRILNCMGMRAEESPARAKRAPFRFDGRASNGRRHVDEWLPLHHWTVETVWARIASAGTRPHPAYEQGMPRLSCSFCVLASRGALVRAARLRPDLAEDYRAVEERIGHTFRKDLSMAQIVAQAAATDDTARAVESWVA